MTKAEFDQLRRDHDRLMLSAKSVFGIEGLAALLRGEVSAPYLAPVNRDPHFAEADDDADQLEDAADFHQVTTAIEAADKQLNAALNAPA